MQREPVEILTQDNWPLNKAIMDGVEREVYATYKVSAGEIFAIVSMSAKGPPETKPEVLAVEVAPIGRTELNNALVSVICGSFKGALAHRIFGDRLRAFMEAGGYVQLLCHPDVRLPELSAIRHSGFDPPGREQSVIYACQKDAGVLISADQGRRGAFIRPQKFCKIVLESPIPTSWDRLDQDPFGGED